MSSIPASTIRHALIYSAFAGLGAWIGRGGLHEPIWPLILVVVVLYMPGALAMYYFGYQRGRDDLRRHLRAEMARIDRIYDRKEKRS